MTYSQYSGITISNISFTESIVTVTEDDACLFSNVNSPSSEKSNLKLFPNPFNNFLEISFDENTSGELIIRDMMGKIIQSEKINGNSVSINTENIAAGIYSLSIMTSENKTQSSLIIKQ